MPLNAFIKWPDGFHGAKFGMTIEGVKEIAGKEGGTYRNLIKEEDGTIACVFDGFLVQGERAAITYVFSSHGLRGIAVKFRHADYLKVREWLINKYGDPTGAQGDRIGLQHDAWVFGDVLVLTYDGRSGVVLSYTHMGLCDEEKKETASLKDANFSNL